MSLNVTERNAQSCSCIRQTSVACSETLSAMRAFVMQDAAASFTCVPCHWYVVQALSSFAYESSDVVVHRDTALMPTDVRDHNSINFIVDAEQRTTMATLVLPDPSQPGAVVYQSWNPPTGYSVNRLLPGI
eukprot:17839-Heterococcus_DN1.PRE.5